MSHDLLTQWERGNTPAYWSSSFTFRYKSVTTWCDRDISEGCWWADAAEWNINQEHQSEGAAPSATLHSCHSHYVTSEGKDVHGPMDWRPFFFFFCIAGEEETACLLVYECCFISQQNVQCDRTSEEPGSSCLTSWCSSAQTDWDVNNSCNPTDGW